ncbi:MAG: hypothetical protein IPM29_15640 [Planctomycetes bacterium]|nr:hypothetical protein [Planctomycetota bacterium]
MVGALAVVACRGGDDRSAARERVPARFARVAGNAVAVIAAREPAAGAGVAAAIGDDGLVAAIAEDLVARLAGSARIEVRRDEATGITALHAVGLQTGWADLRESVSFQDAWAALPATGSVVVFADLQLAVDLARRELGEAQPQALARTTFDALGFQAFDWCIATIDGSGPEDPLRVEAVVHSNGSTSGVTALLRDPGGAPAVLADPAPAAAAMQLRLDAFVDPDVARAVLDELSADQERSPLGGALGSFGGGLRKLAGELLAVADGRISAALGAGDERAVAAVGLRDAAGARAVLDRFGRRVDDDQWLVSGEWFVRIDGDRAVLLSGEDASLPPAGVTPAGAALAVRALGAAGPLELDVAREGRAVLRLRGRLPR